jgi:Flp pilus assembly pilin Flp
MFFALVQRRSGRRATTAGSLRARLSEHGATAVEYALMVGLIAVVIVGAVTLFGLAVSDLFIIPAGVFGGP